MGPQNGSGGRGEDRTFPLLGLELRPLGRWNRRQPAFAGENDYALFQHSPAGPEQNHE
jgi:hypothetical protein